MTGEPARLEFDAFRGFVRIVESILHAQTPPLCTALQSSLPGFDT
jgi:hypothetical protein